MMDEARRTGRTWLRGPQDVGAGIFLIGLAAIALSSLSGIRVASYIAFSPALFPRICAWILVGGGVVLIGRGLLREGPPLVGLAGKPVILIGGAVVLFGLVAPMLGYLPAGLLTVLVGGLAAPDLRLRALVLMAVGLGLFSVTLFTVFLKLPLPVLILPGLRI